MGWIRNSHGERGGDRPSRTTTRINPPLFTLGGLALILAIAALFGYAPDHLVYDRDAIRAGELWRLVTGHLVHLDAQHLLWNGIALGLIGLFLELIARQRARTLLVVTAGLMAAVDLYLWWGRADIMAYCGLSALLNGMLAFCLVQLRALLGRLVCWLFALGALAKIGFEMMAGAAIVTDLAWPAMPDAHLAGFLAGGLVGLALAALRVTLLEFQILPAERDKDAV